MTQEVSKLKQGRQKMDLVTVEKFVLQKVQVYKPAPLLQPLVTADKPEILNFKDTECATPEEIERLDNHLSNNGKRKYKAEKKY